jgi:hypothetical protein|tara:strand:- start:116 stop:697 length:582 start_codon:yes stop_codon:yes gene_type:complete
MPKITRRIILPTPEDDLDHWKARALKAESQLGKLRQNDVVEGGFDVRKRVFEAWQKAFKKKRGVFKSGDKRDKAIKSRLKNWDVEELVKCVEGYSMDPWRHEQHTRHELATLMRNDTQIESGLDIFDDGGRRARTSRTLETNTGKGNLTIDYTDSDRGKSGGVTDFRGNTLPGDATGREPVRREHPMGLDEIF